MGVIVVGVDGSEGSQRALEWAASEARLRTAPLRVVYGYEYTPAWQMYGYGVFPSSAPEPLKELADDQAATGRRLVEQMAAPYRDDGLTIETLAMQARRPVEALIEASREADLLVVGSRGRGGFAGLVLGSVSQQCVQHATCPVVVVPADPGG